MSTDEFPVDPDEFEHRRRGLRRQAEQVKRGETPAPLEPYREEDSRSCTQVPNRYSGFSRGTHSVDSRNSGTQSEVREVSSRGATGVRAGQRDQEARIELPLPDYIRYAAEKNARALEEAKEWQGPAWTFCRYMKGHPALQGLTSIEAADLVDQELSRMFPESNSPWTELIPDVDSIGQANDPFDHFVESWDAIENEVSEAPLEKALRLAEEHPVELVGYRSERWEPYRRFLSICRWLQVVVEEESFYAPVRKFSELLGIPISSVSNYRRRAERDGYLVKVEEHQGWKKATEYRFEMKALRSEGDSSPDEGTEEWGEVP